MYYGPNLNVSQAFYKNTLRVSIGTSYNQVLLNDVKSNELFNHRLSFNYSPKFKNQKFGRVGMNVSAIYTQKLKTSVGVGEFSEFTGNVGLNYSF